MTDYWVVIPNQTFEDVHDKAVQVEFLHTEKHLRSIDDI